MVALARIYPGKKTLSAREQDPDARATLQAEMAQVEPDSLVFLDETSPPTTLAPLYARSPRGERVVGRAPRGRRTAVSLLAVLTPDGLGPGLQLPGAIDRIAFAAFIEQALVPTLRPGQIVAVDNRSVHKSARARRAIEAANCASCRPTRPTSIPLNRRSPS